VCTKSVALREREGERERTEQKTRIGCVPKALHSKREGERERTEQKASVGCVPKALHCEREREREREREIVLIEGGASSLCALRRGRKATIDAATGMMCYETKS